MSIVSKISALKRCWFTSLSDLGSSGKNSAIGFPVYITSPKNVHMEDNTVIRLGAYFINNSGENIFIKKYTVVGPRCTIVTNNHRSTVGIPQVLLGASHVNDNSGDIIINEDVWIGANVTILYGAELGRGCIVGACSMVNKHIPPYALVVGSPARIVGVKFTLEQILEHEKALYPEDERMSKSELKTLFEIYYKGVKVFGVQTDFSDSDIEHLEWAKKQRHFIEPQHGPLDFGKKSRMNET